MRLSSLEERDRLLDGCQREAIHLELRDSYAVHSEAERFAAFQATGRYSGVDSPDRRRWLERVQALTQAGRHIRRLRVVSEPITDYIRFEHAGTEYNVQAGEEVRWLPRRLASALTFPGNDFWLFDDATAIFTVFTGTGEVAERQFTTEAATVELCRSSFAAAWSLAIPHSEYRPQ